MSFTTMILLEIALILFLLVLLLELSKPKKTKNSNKMVEEPQVFFNKGIACEERLPKDFAITEQLISLQARLEGLNQKTEMAHARLEDLETELVKSKNSLENSKILELEEKFRKLDNFKANAEVEIQALKEIIAEQMRAKQPKVESSFERQKRLDDEWLQSVVFNSRRLAKT